MLLSLFCCVTSSLFGAASSCPSYRSTGEKRPYTLVDKKEGETLADYTTRMLYDLVCQSFDDKHPGSPSEQAALFHVMQRHDGNFLYECDINTKSKIPFVELFKADCQSEEPEKSFKDLSSLADGFRGRQPDFTLTALSTYLEDNPALFELGNPIFLNHHFRNVILKIFLSKDSTQKHPELAILLPMQELSRDPCFYPWDIRKTKDPTFSLRPYLQTDEQFSNQPQKICADVSFTFIAMLIAMSNTINITPPEIMAVEFKPGMRSLYCDLETSEVKTQACADKESLKQCALSFIQLLDALKPRYKTFTEDLLEKAPSIASSSSAAQ